MAYRPQQLAGECLHRELDQQLLDRPEADREVVAVVPVAEDGIQLGERDGVAIDDAPRAR